MKLQTIPKVSVIVAIYKVEKYIERCARSLFEQTLDDIEFLFIDDCTPDNSIVILRNVIEEYSKRKPQVVIHHMEKNSGQAAVRKWGIQNATGEYIIHCDSDDWVDKDMYRSMYEMAKQKDADIAICDYVITDGYRNLRKIKGCGTKKYSVFVERILFQKERWALWNKMFKKSLLSKEFIFPKGNLGEDMVICIQLLLKGSTMVYVPQSYYKYYINSASITNKKDILSVEKNYRDMKNNADLLIDFLACHNIRSKKWINNGLHYCVQKNLYDVIHKDKKYRKLWMGTYPGWYWIYMVNPYMDIKSRIKCFLAYLGLYPFK